MIRSAISGGGSSASGFSAPPASMAAAPAASTALTIPVKLPNGQIVNVGTQAEVDALRASVQPTQMVDLSKPTASSGGTSTGADFLDIGADALQAVGGFLAGSKYNRLLQDLQDAQDDLQSARNSLAAAASTDPGVQSATLAAIDAMIAYQDATIAMLNAQITAVDMAAGGSAAKIVSKFMNGGLGTGNGGGMGTGTALALGAGGIGLGLLLSSNSNNNSSSTRRR